MQAYTPPDTKATRAEYGWRYIFTRMAPTAIIVFFILFTFFPDFGSPVSNLRRLGEGSGRLSSEQQKRSRATITIVTKGSVISIPYRLVLLYTEGLIIQPF